MGAILDPDITKKVVMEDYDYTTLKYIYHLSNNKVAC